MYFCDKCNSLCPDDRCPNCGNRSLRAPEPDDFCFLTERDMMWAEMLRAALADAGIESAYRPVLGAAVSTSIGKALERYQIYVPVDCYDEAQDVMLALFGETRADRSPASIWKQ